MVLSEILDQIQQAIKMPLSYFDNPGKRIYWLYLLSSLGLAYYVWVKKKRSSNFFSYIFNKKVWTSPSAFVDYSFVFFNSLIKIFLIGPYLILGYTMAYYVDDFATAYFGMININVNKSVTLILYTLALTIANDFASFIVHYAMHKWTWLWEFHKIHHSATSLNPITQYRLHPIELIINNAKSIFIFGLITGIFDFISDHQIQKIYFLGASVFSFLFLFWGANLRHSHVKLKYFSFLERIFISPVQHQIHHSDNPKHYDKNMGAKLAIWDYLFGTLITSKGIKHLSFGLNDKENIEYHTFWQNLYMPFKNIGSKIKKLFIRS